jgi:hypothetical protein
MSNYDPRKPRNYQSPPILKSGYRDKLLLRVAGMEKVAGIGSPTFGDGETLFGRFIQAGVCGGFRLALTDRVVSGSHRA